MAEMVATVSAAGEAELDALVEQGQANLESASATIRPAVETGEAVVTVLERQRPGGDSRDPTAG
jgi:hypothetical protein